MDYIFFREMDKEKRVYISERANDIAIFVGIIIGTLGIVMFGYSLGIMKNTEIGIISKFVKAFLSVSPFGLVVSVFYAVDVLFSLKWSTLADSHDEEEFSGYQSITMATLLLIINLLLFILYILD